MNLTDDPRDTVRAAFLPLDCPQATLQPVIQSTPKRILENPDGFEQYVQAALDTVTITPRAANGIETVRELLTFAALTPLRIQRADPLVDTAYERREPAGSAERRMLHQPLLKHPGLTWFERNAREYYIATLTHFFEQTLPEALQAEIAAVLLAPDRADPTTKTAYQTYADTDTETVHRRYADRIDITENGDIRVATDHVSRCCQLLPKSDSPVGYAYSDRFDYLQVNGGVLVIPQAQFRLHLAEYAWHAWEKLVNTAFNTVHPTDVDRLVTATPRAETDIYGRFERNNTIYMPYYGTSGIDNPKRDWALRTDQSLTNRPLQREDKRLITVVDCIRASQDLNFDLALPLDTLFDRLRRFFPAPHRPGNDIRTKTTLQNALKAATDTRIKVGQHPDVNEPVCVIPQPTNTPYHPTPTIAPWDCYRKTLATQRHADPDRKPGNSPLTHQINPLLPHELTPEQATAYETQLARTQQTAVTTPRTNTTIQNVTPRINPESLPHLTRDEIVVLTRISLAMERLLDDASLTRSMRPLRYDDTGTELHIDEAKLRDRGWLERHDEGTGVLYTVPAAKRQKLGVKNIPHDGYGEKTPAEKSVHRKGIDRCAAALAAKPDVTRVIRYCDLWRLRNTHCELALADHDLFSTRIDVIAFNETTPKYAAGIETASGSAKKSQRCIQKLTALTETLETWLVTPNSTHLWTVMNRVNDPDCLDFNTFPNSSPDNYGRANWQRELTAENFLGTNFNTLHTFRSLPHAKLDPKTDDRQHKILGNI